MVNLRRSLFASIIPTVAEPDFLPLQDAAKAYRTSTDTLYRLIRAGRLAKYRREFDRRTWLKRSELDAAFKPRRQTP
jgi:Helix-turn-helix domain